MPRGHAELLRLAGLKFQCAIGQGSRRLSCCGTLSLKTKREYFGMESDPTVGWLAAVVIGGIAGWLAGWFIKNDLGPLMNVVLGMTGAFGATAILGILGISLGAWIGYPIAGVVGACLLIAVVRQFRDLPPDTV